MICRKPKIHDFSIKLSFAILFSMAFTGVGFGQSGQQKFIHSGAVFKTPIDDVLSLDLNNDAVNDIILQNQNKLSVFFKLPSPQQLTALLPSVELPSNAFLYCFADVTGDAQKDLLIMTPDGISCCVLNNEAFEPAKPLISCPSVFEGGSSVPVYLDFSCSTGGNNHADLMIFARNGYAVFRQDIPGEFVLLQEFTTNLDMLSEIFTDEVNEISFSTLFPRFAFADFNADGKNDFFIIKTNSSAVYLQGKDGKFKPVPDAVINSAVYKKKKTAKKKIFYYELPPFLGDVNGDNFADVISTYPSKGRTGVFLGNATPASYDSPARLFKLDGWFVNQWVCDINNDSLDELVLMHMDKIGILKAFEVLSSKTLDAELYVYMMGSGKIYNESPSYTLGITVPISIVLLPDKEVDIQSFYVVSLDGDFNRDGLKDLLVKTRKDTFEAYYGNAKMVFSSNPDISEKLVYAGDYPETKMLVSDLNSDKVSDIIVVYKKANGKTGAVELILSK